VAWSDTAAQRRRRACDHRVRLVHGSCRTRGIAQVHHRRRLVASITRGAARDDKGSPHDNSDFYRLVEETGARIVASDHVFGDPTFAAPIDEDGDPMDALTGYYQLASPSIRSYPQSRQDERFMALVETASVEGVVFYHDEYDDTLGWDYPEQKRLLDARGTPSLFLKRQSYRHPDRSAQHRALRDLLTVIAGREIVAR
jgi:2-hydroxyglutaryl-CoA dehydratase, D-component